MKRTLLVILVSFFSVAMFAQDSPDGSTEYSGFDEVLLEQPTVSIYPNPATNYISIDNDTDVKTIAIYNLVGRKLQSFRNVQKNERYDIADLANGIYLVQILNHSDKIIATHRLNKR